MDYYQQARMGQPVEAPRRRSKGIWKKIILAFGVLVLLLVLGLMFIARPYVVSGVSMEPTVSPGDRVLVIKYQFGRTPNRGDIVVMRGDSGELLIKRVVAIAGDLVTIDGDSITVNGEEQYPNTLRSGEEEREIQVPHRSIFVRGDNQRVSYDSRYFGTVSVDRIVGKAVYIFWPLNHMEIL